MEEIDSSGVNVLLLTVTPDQSLWGKAALAQKNTFAYQAGALWHRNGNFGPSDAAREELGSQLW